MSALGQKRTIRRPPGYIRFTSESGHCRPGRGMSALCQKRTFALTTISDYTTALRRAASRAGLSEFDF